MNGSAISSFNFVVELFSWWWSPVVVITIPLPFHIISDMLYKICPGMFVTAVDHQFLHQLHIGLVDTFWVRQDLSDMDRHCHLGSN